MLKKPLLMVVFVFCVVACSSNQVVRAPLDMTIGQQLIDLKKAHSSGALSNAEYDLQRSRLINHIE